MKDFYGSIMMSEGLKTVRIAGMGKEGGNASP